MVDHYTPIIIIINIVFVRQYKTTQHHELQINLESAVYSLNASAEKKKK